MSQLWFWLAVISSVVLGLVGSRRAIRGSGHQVRANYAGRPVPVVLGAVLVRAGGTGLIVSLGLALLAGPVRAWPIPVVVLLGTYLLFYVGSVDDRSESGIRGLRAHLAALARGQVTTGIWKLMAGGGCAVVVALMLGGGFARVILSALTIALSINVTNAMDVRPGRALKWAGLWLFPISILGGLAGRLDTGLWLSYGAYQGAGFGVLWPDMGEKGMLGDAGSNPLGFVLGASLAGFLPFWGLAVVVVILGGLQLAAETITISRLVEDVPPLRWFDRLGRRN